MPHRDGFIGSMSARQMTLEKHHSQPPPALYILSPVLLVRIFLSAVVVVSNHLSLNAIIISIMSSDDDDPPPRGLTSIVLNDTYSFVKLKPQLKDPHSVNIFHNSSCGVIQQTKAQLEVDFLTSI